MFQVKVICLRLTLIVIAFACSPVIANSSLNLSLPGAGGSLGSDSFKAGDLDCKNSIGGATNFEIGFTGIVKNAIAPFFGKEDLNNPQSKDIGLYARITIPLDAPAERINCNILYQLELQRRRLEVQKLRQEIEMLKLIQNNTTFEN